MEYSKLHLATYFLIYSFLGWVLEVGIVAVRDRRFRNRGFVNLPFCPMYGVMMLILMLTWPSLAAHRLFKFVFCFAVFVVVQSLTEVCTQRLCRRMVLHYEDITPYNGSWMNLLVAVGFSAVLWFAAEMFQPLLHILVTCIPPLVLKLADAVIGSALAVDFVLMLLVMRQKAPSERVGLLIEHNREQESDIKARLYKRIWDRIEKTYPKLEREPEIKAQYVFAKGLCADKILWIFLASAFIGDLIETVYCRVVGGVWISRSSVLYGPFSIVWGLGAVVLTVVLFRFAKRDDRYIFFVGALLGGVYEYACSLFTEIVFGTVFWDYSWMPFNIGGRTNLLYMGFWGILAVVWIKVCYPRMSRVIERVPVLPGKIITYALILFMVCNALLSAMAMLRYTERKADIPAKNTIEVFLDETYGDTVIERVWPNMILTEE